MSFIIDYEHESIKEGQGALAIDDALDNARQKLVLVATISYPPSEQDLLDEYSKRQELLSTQEIEAFPQMIEALRKMIVALNQAMADAAQSADAGFALSGLAGSIRQMAKQFKAYASIPPAVQDVPSLALLRESMAIRQNAVHIEKQLSSHIGNGRLPASLRQNLRAGRRQIQKALIDMARGNAKAGISAARTAPKVTTAPGRSTVTSAARTTLKMTTAPARSARMSVAQTAPKATAALGRSAGMPAARTAPKVTTAPGRSTVTSAARTTLKTTTAPARSAGIRPSAFFSPTLTGSRAASVSSVTQFARLKLPTGNILSASTVLPATSMSVVLSLAPAQRSQAATALTGQNAAAQNPNIIRSDPKALAAPSAQASQAMATAVVVLFPIQQPSALGGSDAYAPQTFRISAVSPVSAANLNRFVADASNVIAFKAVPTPLPPISVDALAPTVILAPQAQVIPTTAPLAHDGAAPPVAPPSGAVVAERAVPQQPDQPSSAQQASAAIVEDFRNAEHQQNTPLAEKSLDERIQSVNREIAALKKEYGDEYKRTDAYKALVVEQKKLIEEKKQEEPPAAGEDNPCDRPCGSCPNNAVCHPPNPQ